MSEGETFVVRYRVELVRERTGDGHRPRVEDAETAVRWLRPIIAPYDRKILGALYLDAHNQALGYSITYVGSRKFVPAEPRAIFVAALLSHTASLVVFQNHLYGHPASSVEDLHRHARFRAAGVRLRIPVAEYLILDHLGRFVTLCR